MDGEFIRMVDEMAPTTRSGETRSAPTMVRDGDQRDNLTQLGKACTHLEQTSRRIGLVGCVKDKAATARPARDLYLSSLFRGRRRYVEHSCDEWWILSALHGLVDPDEMLEPYDVALKDASRSAKREWSVAVLRAIDQRIHPSGGDIFEMHAGADYRLFGLEDGLRDRDYSLENPTQGLSLGRQLAFYSRSRWN